MAIVNTNSTIEEDIATIRSAIYGQDMRTAIADGIEKTKNKAGKAVLYDETQNLNTIEKRTARNNIDAIRIEDLQGKFVRCDTDQGLGNDQKQTARNNIDAVSTTSLNSVKTEIDNSLDELEYRIEDLEYVPIEIESFTFVQPPNGLVEMNSVVDSITVSWRLNKVPSSLEIDIGMTMVSPSPSQSNTASYSNLGITEDESVIFKASDRGSHKDTTYTVRKSLDLHFCNIVYYGSAAIPSTINSYFISHLNGKVLSESKARTVTVNASSGQYIWYAVPVRLGTCSFNVGGFDGGFETPLTVAVTNQYDYTEDYYVYRSTNPSLGNTTVKVT